jgi:hypothetical protein
MSERKPAASQQYSAIRALRLDAWRVPAAEPVELMLGSLTPILGDFAPARRVALVPAQRSAPEVPDWLRHTG